jgi:hypothetical protein
MTETFSKEIPELLQSHLDHLLKSAISLEVIKERGYKSVFSIPDLEELGFKKRQIRRPVSGILIPLHGVDKDKEPIGYQFRPDNPREEIRDGGKVRKIKYENPVGAPVRIDVPPRCKEILEDPAIPLFVTEGSKKGDAIATAGGCVIVLTGVYGFKGKNTFGGVTVLVDFDYIAWKDRLVYMIFDSDSASNPQVYAALLRFSEIIKRKGAKVHILQIPQVPNGEKVGADDYLAQGHTLNNLISCKTKDDAIKFEEVQEISRSQYTIENGFLCYIRKLPHHGMEKVVLGNFVLQIVEDIIKDKGEGHTERYYKIKVIIADGQVLPLFLVKASEFDSLRWLREACGTKTIIEPGQNVRDRIRHATEILSPGAKTKTVFAHTGFKEVNGKLVYLSTGGAIGDPSVDVYLDSPVNRYSLPQPSGDPGFYIEKSMGLMNIANIKATLPAWTFAYLAPLNHFLPVNFILWLLGGSNSFKTVLQALVASHFGDFTHLSIFANWFATQTEIEHLLFICKDVVLPMDDFAPPANPKEAARQELMAEYLARAIGNRQGKARSTADQESRPQFPPRGILITSGEQMPGGYSRGARILPLPVKDSDYYKDAEGNLPLLDQAQKDRQYYPMAMGHYIKWIIDKQDIIKPMVEEKFETYRHLAPKGPHRRLIDDIAILQTGLEIATLFTLEKGVTSETERKSYLKDGWEIFQDLTKTQNTRLTGEKPSIKFVEAVRELYHTRKICLRVQTLIDGNFIWLPNSPQPGQEIIGWDIQEEDLVVLEPGSAYKSVFQFYRGMGGFLGEDKVSIWRDLKKEGYLAEWDDKNDCLPNHYVPGFGGGRRLVITRSKLFPPEEKNN